MHLKIKVVKEPHTILNKKNLIHSLMRSCPNYKLIFISLYKHFPLVVGYFKT